MILLVLVVVESLPLGLVVEVSSPFTGEVLDKLGDIVVIDTEGVLGKSVEIVVVDTEGVLVVAFEEVVVVAVEGVLVIDAIVWASDTGEESAGVENSYWDGDETLG